MKAKELLKILNSLNEEALEKDILVSVDVSKSEEDFDHRLYASMDECIVNDPNNVILLSILFEDNYE